MYAKAKQDNVPAHILRKLKEAFERRANARKELIKSGTSKSCNFPRVLSLSHAWRKAEQSGVFSTLLGEKPSNREFFQPWKSSRIVLKMPNM
jgi:hypothetical protein